MIEEKSSMAECVLLCYFYFLLEIQGNKQEKIRKRENIVMDSLLIRPKRESEKQQLAQKEKYIKYKFIKNPR